MLKKAWNDTLKMPLNSLPEADLNLPEMKTKSSSCPSGGVHMYAYAVKVTFEKNVFTSTCVYSKVFGKMNTKL